ncbi:MmcQ/YjbR family DNA-binding protein [Cellulomonas timonensis]|uniref:MmcQ/YjbR family DNA-binding protein n=1 Tax=Cellulomonas timonensis TaxID=1689271 RepID=UPI0009EDA4A7|nr:MmcQ/YjbR family DNA-binding protein [Cellulomonas timonensis]
MTHPRMYDEHDPCLAQVRLLAAGFPESSEVESWGRPTFRAGRRIFAAFGTQVSPHGLVLRPDEDERAALLGDPRFSVPPYYGPAGWLALDLDAEPLDWDEVAELLDDSYRQVALRRMLRALDGRPASPRNESPPQAHSTQRLPPMAQRDLSIPPPGGS